MTDSLPWQTYDSEIPLQPQGSYTCEHCHMTGPYHQAPWGCIPAMRREIARLQAENEWALTESNKRARSIEAMRLDMERLINSLRIYADRGHWHPQHPSFYIGPRYTEPWTVAQRALPDGEGQHETPPTAPKSD